MLAPGGRFAFVTVSQGYWGSRLNRLLPEATVRALLGLLYRRTSRDIFPAFYRLNTRADILAAFQGAFRVEIKEYREYYGFSRLFFWVQHALCRLFPASPLFASTYLVLGERAEATRAAAVRGGH